MSGKYEKKQEKKRIKQIPVPAWLFVVLMAVFYELLLHCWTTVNFSAGRLAAITAFALGLGFLLAFIANLFPNPKVSKGVSIGIAVFLAVLYMLEYFLLDAYQNFMTIETILGNAGGVATDYFSLIMSLLSRNLWRIFLVLLPIVLYGVFCENRKVGWKLRGVLAAAAVVLYLLGFGAVNLLTNDSAVMKNAYNFDGAVRVFGLHMGLVLDVMNSSGSADAELEFVAAPTMPTTPVQETQPQEQTAETEATEPAVVYGDNVLDLDYAALAESYKTGTVASLFSYVASQTPTNQNAYTGLFEGKNLIFITAEAFTAEVIDPELTPTLYRLANNGIKFTDYYQPAWGASTTTGEFSNLIGIVPTGGGNSMWETVEQDLFLTIGNQLKDLGYYSTAYHNHLHDFYNRNKTHLGLGYDRFIARFAGMDDITPVWPESDLEMMELTVSQYIDQQPFNIYYMSVSGHCLYTQDQNAMSRKNYDKVADLPYSEAVKCYLAANLELEYALEYLVAQLEEAGIADDTVIVIATDHYPYGLENSSTWQNNKDYLSELYGYENTDVFTRDHNALIIWSGCIEGQNIQVDDPVYSLDILPTLSNLFGVAYDSRLLVGRDVFSDAEPLVLWPNYSWKTDKGCYNFQTGTFTPAEGVEVDEGYVEYISAVVSNKITYSRSVQDVNFYNSVVKALNAAEAETETE